MTATNTAQTTRNLFSRFKRGQAWKEYVGYHVGDIHENQPIAIPAGSTVVGNVSAPQIMILGLLSGSAIGRDVVISSGGAVWGDVFAIHFQLETGGKVRGWIHSMTESDLENHKSAGIHPVSQDNGDSPDGLKPEHQKFLDREQFDLLKQLQSETAVALAARTELEESFDQRLSEMAGEATNKLALLREELKNIKLQLDKAELKAEETGESLEHRNIQFNRQSEELANTQDLLAQTTTALEKLQITHAQQEEKLVEMRAAKAGADTHLEEALSQVDTLTGRVHNIETALQASLVHTSDQEDALLRWQELAELNEQKVEELEKELKIANHQNQESNDLLFIMREQRQQLEKEWTEAHARIAELEKQIESTDTDQARKNDESIQSLEAQYQELQDAFKLRESELVIKNSRLEELVKLKEAEVSDARLHYKKLHIRWKKTHEELDTFRNAPAPQISSAQLEELNQKIKQTEETAEQYQEQIHWNQASLETAQAELTQIRQFLQEKEQIIQHLQQENREKQEQFVHQSNEINALKETIKEQEEQTQRMLEEHKDEIRLQRTQLEASEKELSQYLDETSKQGSRLAEMQATLVERDIELQETKQLVAKQQRFIKQLQQATKKRIQELQTQLAAK